MLSFTLFCLIFYLTPALQLVLRGGETLYSLVFLIRRIVWKKTPSPAVLEILNQKSFFKKQGKKILEKINRGLGIFEYFVRAPRNLVFGWLFTLLFAIHSLKLLVGEVTAQEYANLGFPILILSLTWWSRYTEIIASLRLAEFLRRNPAMHPQSYFDAVYQTRGPFFNDLPNPMSVATVTPQKVSFRKEKRAYSSHFLLLWATWDTIHLAHTSLKSLWFMGSEFAREVFDAMGGMWGKRLLQLFHASLEVEGGEKLERLPGKILLVPNHKSQLDFALSFFALSHIRLPSGRGIRPRFIVARDHFLDNPFVYRIVGVGRLIETVDMVFIDRKKSKRGFENLKQAAEFLASKEIDIAIFPQGTRAEGNLDRSGKRRDAGYYTTVPPKDMDADLGHLRKGTAFLAADTLMELYKGGRAPLHLVFIGISGTATAMAKQSLAIQTETEIVFRIGDPLTLTADLAKGIAKPEGGNSANESEQKYLDLVEEIHAKIDRHLVDCLKIHDNLRHRFLLDLQGYFRYLQDKIRVASESLEKLSQDMSLPYQILDRIYACPLKDWNPFLFEFAQLLLEGGPVKKLEALRKQVTIRLLEGLQKKVHGKRVKKRELQEKN